MSTLTTRGISRQSALGMISIFGLVILMFSMILLPSSAVAVSSRQSSSSQAPASKGPTAPFVGSPDFNLTTNPASVTLAPGQTTTVTITSYSLNGFAGNIYLTASAYPIIVSLNPSSLTLSSGGKATSTLTITIPSTDTPGPDGVFIEAKGGCSLTSYADVAVTVTGPDFTIKAEKNLLTVSTTVSDSTKLNLASTGGFSGTVSISTSSSEFTVTPSTASVSLSGGTASTTMSVVANPGVEPGIYGLSFDASSGILSHSADVYVNVTGSTFSLSSSKFEVTLVPGVGTNSSIITASPIEGFSGKVTLTVTPSYPPGIVSSLSAPSVTLPPAQQSTLTVSAPASLKPGVYDVGVTGTNGTITKHTGLAITVKAPDFDIFAYPSDITLQAGGSSCQTTITVTGYNSFTGTVGLTAQPITGITTSFSTTSVSIPGPGTSTLTISGSSSLKAGFYTEVVNGTVGTTVRSTDIFITVIGPDFELSANPDTLTITAGSTPGTSTIGLNSENGFTGIVTLTNSSYDSGITLSLSSNSISGSGTATLTVTVAGSVLPGSYSVEVTGTSGSLTHYAYVSITVLGPDFTLSSSPASITFSAKSSATATITVNPIMGFSDPVDLFAYPDFNLNASILPSTVTSGSYTATLSVNSTIPGSYSVLLFGSTTAGLSHYITISVKVTGADFSLKASPSSLSIPAGSSSSTVITVQPTFGFKGSITLSVASPPTGVAATPSPVTISESGSSTLTVATAPTATPGSYTIDLQGTNGTLTHDLSIPLDISGFTVSATTPASVPADGTTAATSTITVAPVNGFTGTVTLDDTPLPSGLNCQPLSKTTITGGSGSATLSCTSTAVSTYTVTIKGTSNSLVQTATVDFTFTPPPDFTIAATSPASVAADGATTAISTVTITALNSFTGSVTLSWASSPNTLTCQSTPPTITGGGAFSLSCSSTTAGSFTVTVTGTSGTLSHTATATFNFVDFTISASSPSTTDAGQSAISTITVTAVNGFGGAVSLTDIVPSGLACGAIAPTSVTGSGTATVSCTSTVAGSYTVTVTGKSGTLSHSTPAVFNFQDFGIAASSPPTTGTGASASSTISVTALGSFNGLVTITDTVPSGLNCGSITPGTLTGAGAATVSCSASVAATYTLTVKGTSGALSHSATATFVFANLPDFTITASSPATVDASKSATSTITVTYLNGLTGTVSLTDTAPSGLTCLAISPPSVTTTGTAMVSCSSATAGNYVLTVTGTSGSLVHSSTATFHFIDFTLTASSPATVDVGTSATSTITVNAVNGFTGTVTVTDTAPSGLTCGAVSGTVSGSGTVTISCSATAVGSYTLSLTGSDGTLSHTASATFNFVDFTITSTSPSAIGDGASKATAIVTISALNSFTGQVTLSQTSSPSGLTCTAFSPVSVSGGGTATLSCTATVTATTAYTVTITATSGILSHSYGATFTFTPPPPDFTIAATSPASESADGSTKATSTITVAPVHGFVGTVALTDTVPSGLSCNAISPASIAFGSGTTTLSCTASAAGTYTVTVTGTSGSLSHPALATFTFTTPDFSISANPTSPTIQAGASGSSTITVTSSNGFTGTVSLTYSISPTGPTASLSSASISGGSGTSTLAVNVGSGIAAGTYTVTITATSGSLSHSTTVTVTVTAVQPVASAPSIFGLDPTIFYAIIAVVIVVVIAGAALVLRARKPSATS